MRGNGFIVGSLLALLTAPVFATEQLLDGVAAQVGSRIVLVSEVMRTVAPVEAEMRAAGAPDLEIAKLRADGLERLIEEKLIAQVVEEREFFASEEEVDETIGAIAEENGLSLEQLVASVNYHGISYEEYREQIKEDLERRNVVQAMIGSDIKVDEGRVRELYRERFSDQPEGGEAVHVRQLLRPVDESRSQAQACAEASDALARVIEGESFAKVAGELSQVAAKSGGDIGWLHVDTIAPWMRAALASLEPGDRSAVIALPFGCTVLELVERRDFTPVTFEEAKERLGKVAWEESLEKAYRNWMEGLRERTFIDRRGYFADAAKLGDRTFPVEASPPSASAPQ